MKKYLIVCCISIYAITHTQQTLNEDLMHACAKGNIHNVRQLIAQRAQVAYATSKGATPLMIACAQGHHTIAEVLLKKLGKNGVNAKNNEGASALVLACEVNDLVLVKCLLAKGALVNVQVENGKTLLMRTSKNTPIMKVLLDHAQSHLSPDEFTAFINAQSEKETTALIYACRHGVYESVQLLLEHGADPNISEGATKKTALHYPVFGNKPDLVKLLLKHKADIEFKDAFNHTVLSIAVSQKNIPMVRLLKKHGADPNCRIGVSDAKILTVAQQDPNLILERVGDISISSDVISAQKYAEEIGSMNLQRALAICGNEACKKPGPKSTCAGCKSVHYCNSNCQKADWKNHKPRCEELRAQANENTES